MSLLPSTGGDSPPSAPSLTEPRSHSVLRVADLHATALRSLLAPYGIECIRITAGTTIPGSYWGETEAGLIGSRLYVTDDTPVHSALHEACHFICMDPQRRAALDCDAGGDFAEENAVCYLQIVLADELVDVGRERMWRDMDAWGYTFRLGSARCWFEQDAAEVKEWLIMHRILTSAGHLTGAVRG